MLGPLAQPPSYTAPAKHWSLVSARHLLGQRCCGKNAVAKGTIWKKARAGLLVLLKLLFFLLFRVFLFKLLMFVVFQSFHVKFPRSWAAFDPWAAPLAEVSLNFSPKWFALKKSNLGRSGTHLHDMAYVSATRKAVSKGLGLVEGGAFETHATWHYFLNKTKVWNQQSSWVFLILYKYNTLIYYYIFQHKPLRPKCQLFSPLIRSAINEFIFSPGRLNRGVRFLGPQRLIRATKRVCWCHVLGKDTPKLWKKKVGTLGKISGNPPEITFLLFAALLFFCNYYTEDEKAGGKRVVMLVGNSITLRVEIPASTSTRDWFWFHLWYPNLSCTNQMPRLPSSTPFRAQNLMIFAPPEGFCRSSESSKKSSSKYLFQHADPF